MTSDRSSGKSMKLSGGRLRLGVRKRFFIQRMIEHWKRFPREVVTVSSLTKFKKCLDNAHRLMV